MEQMETSSGGTRGDLVPPILAPHVAALDDDASVRALIAEYLTKHELRVTTVATGTELAEVFARETIDAVILDLRLPGEDGMQIARRLREQSTVPILMLTGLTDEADRVMGLELGADDYLGKPFSPRELLAASARVRRAGERLSPTPSPRRAYRFGGGNQYRPAQAESGGQHFRRTHEWRIQPAHCVRHHSAC
jgi:DNA-binding response OmpR family regulator